MTEQDARNFLAALGAEVAHFRRMRRMSRNQLGALVGISPTTIGRIERADPSAAAAASDVWRIAEALEVPFSVLVVRAEQAAGLGGDLDEPTVG